ncbi:hypothetical protein [Streptomyces albogriseolus]|uniref:hypothetical protein n=1 Tax=Streptomyces albogriseolus TaxID=1887 RepID=UPI003684CF33
MTTSDQLLERIVKRVNRTGTFLDITLIVGGSMITGRLCPRANWLEGNIGVLAQVEEMKDFADDFAHEGGAMDTEDYVHLSQAKQVFGDNMLPTRGGAIRVPITQVQGWMLGHMKQSNN